MAYIGEGKLYHLYRRISRGWKEYWHTDEHYREGETVETFLYRGKRVAIALCGDLWEMTERFCLGEDVLIWPVYISFSPEHWEGGMKQEYAEKALCACPCTLLCNSITEGDAFGGHFCLRMEKLLLSCRWGGKACSSWMCKRRLSV